MRIITLFFLLALDSGASAAVILSATRELVAHAADIACEQFGPDEISTGIYSPRLYPQHALEHGVGAFTSTFLPSSTGGGSYGTGAAGQSSFIGADSFHIDTIYAQIWDSYDGCFYYYRHNTARSSATFHVEFRLLEPTNFTYTFGSSNLNMGGRRAFATSTLTGVGFSRTFNLFPYPYGPHVGLLQPGDYIFDISLSSGDGVVLLGSENRLLGEYRLENVDFILSPVPEPASSPLLLAIAGTVLRRRRSGA
jgi:hypothetical protein